MDLLWIRHAEPERIAGGTGVPANPGLTERGQQQAQRLADWLAHEHVDVVLSSPQRRAQETAAPVAAAHGLDVVIHDGLVEYDVQNDSYIPMEELRANNDPQLLAMAEGWRPWRSLAARLLWHHWRFVTGRPAVEDG